MAVGTGRADHRQHDQQRFTAYRKALGLTGGLDFHSLRRSYVTHLIEGGWDPLFVQQQAGHAHASTTSIYTCVSSDFRTRTLRQALDATIQAARRTGQPGEARRQVGYQWRLRETMAARGMFTATELVPLLAERGIGLSSSQVQRLVTQHPGTAVAAGARRTVRHPRRHARRAHRHPRGERGTATVRGRRGSHCRGPGPAAAPACAAAAGHVSTATVASGAGRCECAGRLPGRNGKKVHCPRCRVLNRMPRLIDDGTGIPCPALVPLTAALAANPVPALKWLEKPHVIELLAGLARGQVPLTHDGLNAWPRPVAARHMRHRLIDCRILPAADPRLLELEAWFCQRLATLASDPHEPLLRQFACWHQLPGCEPPQQPGRCAPPPASTPCSSSPRPATSCTGSTRTVSGPATSPRPASTPGTPPAESTSASTSGGFGAGAPAASCPGTWTSRR